MLSMVQLQSITLAERQVYKVKTKVYQSTTNDAVGAENWKYKKPEGRGRLSFSKPDRKVSGLSSSNATNINRGELPFLKKKIDSSVVTMQTLVWWTELTSTNGMLLSPLQKKLSSSGKGGIIYLATQVALSLFLSVCCLKTHFSCTYINTEWFFQILKINQYWNIMMLKRIWCNK